MAQQSEKGSTSMGEEYTKEQARCRKALEIYKSLGPAGAFGAMCIEQTLAQAERAAISGDIVAQLAAFSEMQSIKL